MRIAVASDKLSPGVSAPGVRWAKWKESFGEPSYDWREEPGTQANTRRVRASYEVLPLEQALLRSYDSDAHLVMYYLVTSDGVPLRRQPRLRKAGLPWVREQGYSVEVDVLFCDVDNPGHAEWTDKTLERARTQWSELEALATAGLYTTKHGCRIVQPLDEPVQAHEAERYLEAWLDRLEAEGIVVDWACRDWTRHFRLPNVVRAGETTAPRLMLLDGLRPLAVVPKAPTDTRLPQRKKRARSVGPVLSALPITWEDRANRLAAGLASVGSGGHDLSLGLSGALLERSIAPEAVPTIVAAATARAGWNEPVPGHYERNAADTVMKWAAGERVRSDVPAWLVALLDELTGQLPRVDCSLPDEQRRLYRALSEAKASLTLVRSPCGLGKSATARRVAVERAAAGKKTVISAPTNELAEQTTAELRATGVAVQRFFGQPSLKKAGTDEPVCHYASQATALAAGGQSVRWELCDGRNKNPCRYRNGCDAMPGIEGDDGASILVGNHGLLSVLERAAGKKGLLVIDEPKDVVAEGVFTEENLVEAEECLGWFEAEAQRAIRPALAVARALLERGPLEAPGRLSEASVAVPGLDELLEDAGALSVAEAARGAVKKGRRAPVTDRLSMELALTSAERLEKLSRVSALLTWLYRAATEEAARTMVFEEYGDRPRKRLLAVTAIDQQLHEAIRRDGAVVVMAADAHLYKRAYADVVCYEPDYVEVGAPDGCQVRRVLLSNAFGRFPRKGNRDASAIRAALDLARRAGPRIAVVTFMRREGFVWAVAQSWAAQNEAEIEVGHYKALRGLDKWKDMDALVSLGDPLDNLSAMSRRAEQLGDERDVLTIAKELARAELEQVHGRLRVIHRTSPCTMVHVGRLVPLGWTRFEEQGAQRYEDGSLRPGRPRNDRGALEALAPLVQAVGGVVKAALTCGCSRQSVHRWLRGEGAPPGRIVSLLRAAADGGVDERARSAGEVVEPRMSCVKPKWAV